MINVKKEANRIFDKMSRKNSDATYLEIIGFKYVIEQPILTTDVIVEYPNELDKIERDEILNYFDSYDFDKDMGTRQAAIQPKYQDDKNKAACISLVHALLRNGKVYMFAHFRSQNFDNNFDYDYQTLQLVMKLLTEKYKLEFGKIYVTVSSLHKYI